MIHDASDAELALRVASSDEDAEGEVCRRMGPRIHLFGLRHLRSAAAADDLVQEVLLKTLEALRAGRLHDGERLASFVLGMCRMTVLDARRTGQRRERLLDEYGDALAPMQTRLPALDTERLMECVGRLRERERSVVVMTFYDELTAAQSGRSLGISEGNIRVIRHRAIRQLRDCLEATT